MLRSVRPLLLLDRLPLCRQLSPALISSDHYLWSLTKCSGSSLGNNSAVGHAVAVAAAAVASPAATTFSTAARYFEQLDALDKSLSTTPAVDNIASWPGIKVWSKGGRSGLKAPYKPPSAAPWTPTSKLIKRKTYQKRSRFLLQVCCVLRVSDAQQWLLPRSL